ncbi:hypothetical protein HK100_002500 [Physocladia obscura]|uniref:Uncharacterized protein n=1 Tax=Physocladia obscura TaxID=109957 RepID=A0AAD5SYD3_9FUNG|nr:hypothetical protein HK100_002500 [Physocladia obscura]
MLPHSSLVMNQENTYPLISVRRSTSAGGAIIHKPQYSPHSQYPAPPIPNANRYAQQRQQHIQYNEWIRKSQNDEKVRALREELAIAKQIIERQAYTNKMLTFQQRLHMEQAEPAQLFEGSRSFPDNYQQQNIPQHYSVSLNSSNSTAFFSTSSHGTAGANIPSNNVFRAASVGSKPSSASSTKLEKSKSISGWTGKSSIRHSNEISDIIIDEICNFELYPIFPQHIAVKCIMKVKEYYYQSSGKGDGANMAIMAILYVCDLANPEFTRRGLETLEFFYATAGVLFWASVSLNLNFWVHFLEHRNFLTEAEKAIAKPMTPFEKDNVRFLCRIFASWYLVDASKQDLEAAGNIQDPTVFIKNFFEALYRAGYEFPPGSLDHIPADKIKAITAWSFKKPPFTLNKV